MHGLAAILRDAAKRPLLRMREKEVTFDDVRKISLAWPEVEDGTSYGTPALKVRKKLLARLKEDGDSQSAISKSGSRFCVRSRSIL